MGLVLGVLCEDGVVIGSDSSRPNNARDTPIPCAPLQKTYLIGRDMVLGSTGDVGFAQRLEMVLRELREDSRFLEWDHFVIARIMVAEAWQEFQATRSDLVGFGALVGFQCATGVHLCELRPGDLQPEFKKPDVWFTALGRVGGTVSSLLGLLSRTVFHGRHPSLTEGIFVTVWALEHGQKLHPSCVCGPFHVAVLTAHAEDQPHPARMLSVEELTEWMDQVHRTEQQLEMIQIGKSVG